jgi:hypothetical protein
MTEMVMIQKVMTAGLTVKFMTVMDLIVKDMIRRLNEAGFDKEGFNKAV